MRAILLATTLLALGSAGPAFAQRSLFDQPVQNPAPAPAPAPAPTAPAAPASPPPAAKPAPTAAAPAPAEEPAAAPKTKAKPKKPSGPVPARALSVSNATPRTLVGLEVSQEGRSAKLKKPLAAGKKTRLALPAFKTCDVTVTATFEGQAPTEGATVDICKEKVLNFKE